MTVRNVALSTEASLCPAQTREIQYGVPTLISSDPALTEVAGERAAAVIELHSVQDIAGAPPWPAPSPGREAA